MPMSASSREPNNPASVRSDMNVTGEISIEQTNKSCINIIAKKRPPPMNIGANYDGIEPTRKVLYRNFHEIDSQVYLIEISRNKKKVFILLFPNFERPDQYIQEILTDKQATKLLNESNNIYESFIRTFFIKFNKLQIRGFHGKAPLERHRTVSPRRAMQAQGMNGYPVIPEVNEGPTSQVVRKHAYTSTLLNSGQSNEIHSLPHRPSQTEMTHHNDSRIVLLDPHRRPTEKTEQTEKTEHHISSLKAFGEEGGPIAVSDTNVNYPSTVSFNIQRQPSVDPVILSHIQSEENKFASKNELEGSKRAKNSTKGSKPISSQRSIDKD